MRNDAFRPARAAAAIVVTLLTVGAPRAGRGEVRPADAEPWRILAPGLELAAFPVGAEQGGGGQEITVLRIDCGLWELTLHERAGDAGEAGGRSARDWVEGEGLVAAINAGMFATDGRTHVGYMRDGTRANNPRVNAYLSAAAFEPRLPGLPPFRIFDLDSGKLLDLAAAYGRVVQNLRLIARPGVNRWEPQEKRWSEAALAEDGAGRALFVFCRVPVSMHELNARLLELPLGVVAAQHLEGGGEAQLSVRVGEVRLDLVGGLGAGFDAAADAGGFAWPIPNVIGVRPRHP